MNALVKMREVTITAETDRRSNFFDQDVVVLQEIGSNFHPHPLHVSVRRNADLRLEFVAKTGGRETRNSGHNRERQPLMWVRFDGGDYPLDSRIQPSGLSGRVVAIRLD
jgi:hypothetical protein